MGHFSKLRFPYSRKHLFENKAYSPPKGFLFETTKRIWKILSSFLFKQFDGVVRLLKSNGVTVITFNDSPLPLKPDAIFPNNWFSTHSDGTVIIYPMMAPSRRLEQRTDIIKFLEDVYKVRHSTFLKEKIHHCTEASF